MEDVCSLTFERLTPGMSARKITSPLAKFLFGICAFDVSVVGVPEVRSNLTHSEGVYNSSTTPSSLPWNTYNYCNAPHVNEEHYRTPTNVSGARLVYLNVMMRHHKVRCDRFYIVSIVLT